MRSNRRYALDFTGFLTNISILVEWRGGGREINFRLFAKFVRSIENGFYRRCWLVRTDILSHKKSAKLRFA